MAIEPVSQTKEFSIIVIPDTQKLSAYHPSLFHKMTRWIVDHAKELNLQMILHLGDVVDNGASIERQYLDAAEAWKTIVSANIPYLIVPGNHDYDNMVEIDRSLTMYNQYFGVHRLRETPWFGATFEEGQAENSYVKLDIAGQKYLFLGLEYGPRNEVLAWADEVMKANPQHKTIIITHCYMYMYGERIKPGDDHNPKAYKGATGANDGEDMWQKSFKQHSNLLAIFSGHQIYENISYRTDIGENGNVILQSFQNWQSTELGGEGRIRILKFRPAENEVTLQVINTNTGLYEQLPGYEVVVPFTPQINGIMFP